MKKIRNKLVLLFVIIVALQVKAQSLDLSRINTPQIIPSSPQSRVFEKYVNHEINEYSGVPEIVIPLYEIEMKGLKIPVTLTYDASGIKYKQYDGEIGAGWSLNIGGYRVSRTVYGKPDETVPFYNVDTFNSVKNNDWQRDIYLAHMNLEYHQIVGAVNAHPNQNWICDGQYDQFTYNLPTTSGHFIITDRNARTVDIMEQNQDKIYINQGNKPFYNMKITDSSGNNYFFSTTGQAEKTMVGNQGEETAWVMNKLVSAVNDSICFSYKAIIVRSEIEHSFTIRDAWYNLFFNTQNNEAEITFNNGVPNGAGRNFNGYYVDEITTAKEIIKIYRYQSEGFKDKIEKITVTNKFSNQVIKTILFKNSQTIIPHRLLDAIEIIGSDTSAPPQKYQFSYYTWNGYTDSSVYPDQWGYYNFDGGNFSSSMPILHSELGNIQYERTPDQWYLLSTIQPPYWRPRIQNNLFQNYFSLKKVTYPTGGYSEYEYEPNRFSQGQGLGWRVKKITSTATDSPKITTIFKYGNNEDGIGNVNFSTLWDFLGFFVNRSIYLSREYYSAAYLPSGITAPGDIIYAIIKHFSQNPTAAEVLSSKVYYNHVAKYEYDGNQNKYNGKTVSIYDMPISYYHMGYQTTPSFCNNSAGFSNTGDLEIRRYYPVSHPVIKEKLYYDGSGNKQKHDLFEYTTKTKIYEGLKAKQFIFYGEEAAGTPIGTIPAAYNFTNFLFSSMEYYIEATPQFPLSHKSIQYIWQGNVLEGSLTFIENYEYNTKNQLVKTTQTNSLSGSLIKNYTYPHDFVSGSNIYADMVTQNMIAPVIEQVSTHNNNEIGRIRTDYFKDPVKTNGFILPGKVQTSASGINNLRTDIIYDLYDTNGNIRQITTIDGISTVYLWSYKGQYPIAEIKDATYSDVEQAAKIVFSVANMDALASMEKPNETKLKDGSLQKALPNAMVTTYTYKPLVGIETITDPRGVTVTYEYDTFGRLKTIKDENNKMLENYEYHYKISKL
ncbi:hypothetical protein AGMMS4957_18830 [Bacteroidia bacterium]|nr:hypothetical protein AGMMS4957_18830 [Bacteroidia bacterium]